MVYIGDNPVLPTDSLKLDQLISVCNLSDITDEDGNVTGWTNMPQNSIAIDPKLGRLAFPVSGMPSEQIHVTYYYGFSASIGGGEYERADTFSTNLPTLVKVVSDGPETIQTALDKIADTGGIVEIQDNNYYFESPVIKVAEGKTIELRAAENKRPILIVESELLIEAGNNSTVIFNGLLIAGGQIRVPLTNDDEKINHLGSLRLIHCTLLPVGLPAFNTIPAQPNMSRLVVETQDTNVELNKTIAGSLQIFEGSAVSIQNSIIDAGRTDLPACTGSVEGKPGGILTIRCSTVIGKVYTRIMVMASNSIFWAENSSFDGWPAPIMAQRLQQGCVRFSYLPLGSRLPGLIGVSHPPLQVHLLCALYLLRYSMEMQDIASSVKTVLKRLRKAQTMKRKWVFFMIFLSHSAKRICKSV